VVVEMAFGRKDLIFAATMSLFSVVIICKNEAGIIGTTLQSLQGLTDDIIVYDNGSTDGSQLIIRSFPVQLQEGSWEGFGKTKNKASALAKHDWILSLDADEAVDEQLKTSLLHWQPENEDTVYSLSFKNFLGNKHLRFGDWGSDAHIRFFNRKTVCWDEAAVHENLQLPANAVIKKLTGHILHRTWRDAVDYKIKMERYARLAAEKYFKQEKKANWFRLHLSPVFAFTRSYILKLGILDGSAGYTCAKMMAWYTKRKYQKLKELYSRQ
jgi:glycosyltransferase involved in cell wall biosynthesis